MQLFKRENFVQILAIGFLSAALTAVGQSQAIAQLKWLCPSDLEEPVSVLVDQSKDRLLIEDSRTRSVPRAMFLVRAPYKSMRDRFRRAVVHRFQIQFYREHKRADFTDAWFESQKRATDGVTFRMGVERFEREYQDALSKLGPLGMTFGDVGKTEIITERYNYLSNREGWSVLNVEIYDGADVLSVPSTILLVSRMDSAKEWGFSSGHNPFSFGFDRRERRFVTSGEYEFIAGVAKEANAPMFGAPIWGQRPLFSYIPVWQEVHEWLSSDLSRQTSNNSRIQRCE
jgi:hypothetical protein